MAKISDSPRRKLFCPVQGQMDIIFFLATMLLLVIGLIMLFSASYPNAYYLLGNSLHYISRITISSTGLSTRCWGHRW